MCLIMSRYKKLEALAQKILAKNPNATDVLDKLKQLKDEQDQMEELWAKKNKELTDAKDLQVTDCHWHCPCNVYSCPFLTSLAVSFYLIFLTERRSLIARVATCHWNVWTTVLCRFSKCQFLPPS